MPSLTQEIHRDIVHARRDAGLHENLLRLNRDPQYLAMIGSRTMMSAEQIRIASRRYYDNCLSAIRVKWDPQLSELGRMKKMQIWEKAIKRNIFSDWLLWHTQVTWIILRISKQEMHLSLTSHQTSSSLNFSSKWSRISPLTLLQEKQVRWYHPAFREKLGPYTITVPFFVV